MTTSAAPTKLYAALLAAKAEMGALLRNAKNPLFNSRYADLAQVLDVVDEPLARHGLLLYQAVAGTQITGDVYEVVVASSIIHAESGQVITDSLPVAVKPEKAGGISAQGVGSAITYGRRYLAMAQFGLAPEDDDANGASGNQAVQRSAKAAPATPKPPAQPSNDVPVWQVADEPYMQWQGPQDAYTWAVEQGACKNEHEARASLKKVVESTGGRFTQNSAPVIFAAFYARQLEKLAEKQPVAA
jgi:hypothetical protein